MTSLGEKKGPVIFIGLILLVIAVSLTAYRTTGDMGIEERFTHAMGLGGGDEIEGGGGWFGLALEGSPLLYALVMGILVAACYMVYHHFSV